MYTVITAISVWAIPALICFILIYGIIKGLPVYETFVEGAKEGFGTAINIIPHLVGMMVAVSIFRASGALDYLLLFISPVLSLLYIPAEVVPLAIIRPISGAGALAITSDLIAQYGPDSFIGRLASTMQGSTDTTLYVLTVYFGAIGVRNIGYALKVGLLADLAGALAAILIVTIVFG
ncbi:nucleoside recognition domain protein [Caldalkalibacillus thermarum TA2.A1]|uniref:Nucleoside recognition domain protein n=1 Tax=Caldalkalibacillus thermarum (strain TA2.A1) TaxID=986075 RepID=F5L637_CALTT|nr:nucleoside recognition domain-containing protein [Caldalkalibacillus thermarum]EGL83191.1 nucleoside recognition domain protein [Caldalkalibacillus thermarum TA2.A1]